MKISTRTFAKRTLAFTVLASYMATASVNAGFLEDFYTSAGAAANITPAQAYQTQSMGVITGGSMVWRAPNRNFVPYHFTPPSLRFGCGGMDAFLGSFGMASKEEFVKFLRNIGQNASGLAFKVALHAMSPDLEAKIQEVSDYINQWNRQNTSSCQAAQALMGSGPNQWIDETVQKTKRYLVATGGAADEEAARTMVAADGGAAIDNAPKVVNEAGKTIESAETNVLWSAFNAGDMGLSDSEKGLMMALVGTTVLRKKGSGTDATLEPMPIPKRLELSDLIGNPTNTTVDLKSYSCADSTDTCLNVVQSTRTEKPFARIVYEKAENLYNAIIDRSRPSDDDLRLLTVTTSIPLYKIIQVTALKNRSYLGKSMLESYSMAVALEVASRYVEDLSQNSQKMLRTVGDQVGSNVKEKALRDILDRLRDLDLQMRASRDEVYQQISKQGAMIAQIEHIERSLYGNLSAQLAANMRFGR